MPPVECKPNVVARGNIGIGSQAGARLSAHTRRCAHESDWRVRGVVPGASLRRGSFTIRRVNYSASGDSDNEVLGEAWPEGTEARPNWRAALQACSGRPSKPRDQQCEMRWLSPHVDTNGTRIPRVARRPAGMQWPHVHAGTNGTVCLHGRCQSNPHLRVPDSSACPARHAWVRRQRTPGQGLVTRRPSRVGWGFNSPYGPRVWSKCKQNLRVSRCWRRWRMGVAPCAAATWPAK